jgi:signal transduction histidine kinase/CheY-like chemotaxis protein
MTDAERIETAVKRDMLQLALRNASRSGMLLLVAVVFIAWLGWDVSQPLAAVSTLVLGCTVALWRWQLQRRNVDTSDYEDPQISAVVRQLEVNAVVVGLMWAVATIFIYPRLIGTLATVYVVVVCGSIATAAFFMSMAGRSFLLLTGLQVSTLAAVSLLSTSAYSPGLAVLALVFGFTMVQTAGEIGNTAARAIRHGLEADVAKDKLERAMGAAESASLAKSQFLATMSHEIRTPMNGVLGALDLLRDTPLDKRQRSLVKTAANSGESLMDILNDVLDHSKIEAGKLQLRHEPMSLHAVANSAAALFHAAAEGRNIVVNFDLDDEVPDAVVGDAPRLKQVLLNLVGNGVKFTESGSVTLRLRTLSSPGEGLRKVRFEVEDTGVGIPTAALEQVFQPFHQVDSTRSRLRGGTGLGLAISQRIIEAMGGRISASSREGRGSCFRFDLVLPLAHSLVLRPQLDSQFGGLDGSAPLSGVVLLVEDNPVNRMIGSEMLKSFGLKVIEAQDGAQGLQLMQQQHVDLVLMDIHMPVLDGYEATLQARERETRLRLPRVPIVALTADAFDEDVAQSMAAGMDAHLAKPYSREQLHELLQRWLG